MRPVDRSPYAGGEAGQGLSWFFQSMSDLLATSRGLAVVTVLGATLGALLPAHAQTTGTAVAPSSGSTAAPGPLAAAPASALRDVVVTATRTEQALADLTADVTVVDRTQIERSGAVDVADVLARQPGIELSRTGGPGQQTSLFVRGADSRFTAVFVDGVRIDSQSTGGAAWETLPLALVDRIEIVRGPAAAVYGSDAVAGVVQIFTRRGQAGAPRVSAGVGVGNQRSYRVEGGVSGGGDRFDYAFGLSREQSAGVNARPRPGQNPDRDGYRRDAAQGRLGFDLAPGQRIEASVLASNLNSRFDSSPTDDDRSWHKLRTYGLNWRAQWSDSFRTRVGVTQSNDDYESRPFPYQTRTRVRGYLWQNEWQTGIGQWTLSAERREDNLVSDPLNNGRFQNALAGGYGLNLGAHSIQANLRRDHDSEFGGRTSGGLSYGYRLTNAWRLTAAAATAFRAPTLYQRFSEYGVAGLAPETARNVELGLRYAEGDSQFGVVAYRSRITNLIGFGGPGACASPYGCYENTGRAQLEGVTLTAAHRIGALRLRASLDIQSPRDRDTDRVLARRARRHGTIGVDTVSGPVTWGGETVFSGARFDNAANTVRLGGYTLWNLYASTKLDQNWSLGVRLDNLFDKQYQIADGYATLGRTVFVTLRWAQ